MRNTESIYNDKKELPAWMKTDKYAKYGSRSGNNSENVSDNNLKSEEENNHNNNGNNDGNEKYDKYDKYAKYNSDKYAKYGVEAKDDRVERLRKPVYNKRRRDKEYDHNNNHNDLNSDGWGFRERESKKHRHETEENYYDQDQQQSQENNQAGDDGKEEETMKVSAYSNISATNPLNSYYQTFQSNIRRDGKDINSIIRTHYNQRTYQSKHQGNRSNSPIIKLRSFNNIIKYILLGEYCTKPKDYEGIFRILDCCCGKGGDLNKMEFIKLDEYIGIDISDGSIREAFNRYNKNKKRFIIKENNFRDGNKFNFESFFATGDLFNQLVPEILESSFPGIMENCFPVNNVSCQFSLHYAFETELKLRCLINNISKSLISGGKFVGTVPSSDFIKRKICEIDPNSDEYSFGNELYKVKFHKKPPMDGDFTDKPFGNGYNFSLKDAIDDVPEYVVPFETLRKICEENELIFKFKSNFIEFFNQYIPKYFKKLNNHLIQSIKRSDGKYGVEGEEKEAVEFYHVFVFEKM